MDALHFLLHRKSRHLDGLVKRSLGCISEHDAFYLCFGDGDDGDEDYSNDPEDGQGSASGFSGGDTGFGGSDDSYGSNDTLDMFTKDDVEVANAYQADPSTMTEGFGPAFGPEQRGPSPDAVYDARSVEFGPPRGFTPGVHNWDIGTALGFWANPVTGAANAALEYGTGRSALGWGLNAVQAAAGVTEDNQDLGFNVDTTATNPGQSNTGYGGPSSSVGDVGDLGGFSEDRGGSIASTLSSQPVPSRAPTDLQQALTTRFRNGPNNFSGELYQPLQGQLLRR